jgi:hypothetical protein
MLKPAIIVPAYRRPEALSRLLVSLNQAEYTVADVQLLISLDGGASADVQDVADSFGFNGGACQVIRQSHNFGLRNHILWCGDQSEKYGVVIVLEDDLVVDPHFYSYAMAAAGKYADEEMIAGVSLYAQRYNEYVGLPFEPTYNGTSAYFMQVPCSWGQAWTARQWRHFRNWYGVGDRQKVDARTALPDVVKSWPESSWKKYFAAYLAETGKYVVYPYNSYATNCADPGGSHMQPRTTLYQVPLGQAKRQCEAFGFQGLRHDSVTYDSFMEPGSGYMAGLLGMDSYSLEIDMYGSKPSELIRSKEYVLTSRPVAGAVSFFPLMYKPLEKNIEFPCGSQEAFFNLARSEAVDCLHVPRYAEIMEHSVYFPLINRRSIPHIMKGIMRKLFIAK